MFKKSICKIQYAIELTKSQFTHIDKLDTHTDYEKKLFMLLDRIPGIEKNDYNGHWGPYIFIDIDKENDNKKTWQAINNLIKIYLDRKINYDFGCD